MSINHRRGKLIDFDPYKMTTGEWAFPDDGTARYCVSPGVVKTAATKEDLQNILNSSAEAYQALQKLINDLTADPNQLTTILNDILELQSNKIGKSDLIQTDTIADMNKPPSSVVTEAHGREIDELTNNLAWGAASNLILQDGWTGTVKYTKNGLHIVNLYTSLNLTVGDLTGPGIIANLPAGYRPNSRVDFTVSMFGAGEISHSGFTIDAVGDLRIRKPAIDSLATGQNIRFNILYRAVS